MQEYAKSTAIFKTANLSLGVNLMQALCKAAAEVLGNAYDVEIIENSDELQAVKKAKSGIAGYVFYKPGASGHIEVDAPVIVMTKEEGETIQVSVCDPTQEAEEVTLCIKGVSSVIESDLKTKLTEIEGGFEMKVSCAKTMSAPYRASFKK